ncbi:MAG: 2-amino-3,7-dideoxy-D-threo-hept-6-ulosonate synthase [Syntrophobacteraceae bacterium]
MSGKQLRLKRMQTSPSGRMVIFPLDHGVSCGPIPGLERMGRVIEMGSRCGADALVLHKGMLSFLETVPTRLPSIFMHLSASTNLGPEFHRKVIVGTVEEAIRRGVDGVSVHINLSDTYEADMLRDLGFIGSACAEWQMPLLVMIYVRGAHAPSPVPDSAIAHSARLAAELGADLIKIPAPTDIDTLAEIAASSPVPVVVAGGSKTDVPEAFLKRLGQILETGVRGVAIGRNIFQRKQPAALLKAVCAMVHREAAPAEALAVYESSRLHRADFTSEERTVK